MFTKNSPGQGFKLQLFVSMATPLQGLPPFAGVGCVQSRTRFCNPSPHVFEQGSHLDQEDQLPSTKQEKQQQRDKVI